MKPLSVFLLAVLFIQATSSRPANDDDDDYEEHEEHSYVFSSSTNPGQLHSAQSIMRGPPFPPMNFGFENPAQQSFGSVFASGGLGGFPSFGALPGFPPLGSMGAGGFGGTGQSFKIPGGIGQVGGFSGPGSAGSVAFAQAGSGSPGGSNSQVIIKPGGFAYTQTSSSGPGSSQVSVSSQSASLQDNQNSNAGGQETTPSIAVEF